MRQQRKTRVFLGAFVNYTNAQNLNCLALTKYLDKTRYEVMTGIGYSGNLPVERLPGVRYVKMRYPARIWRPFCFLVGILWCDVAYLPTPWNWRLCRFLLHLFRKRSFKTVEGAFIGTNMEKALAGEGTRENVIASLSYPTRVYSITEAMKEPNRKALGIETEGKVLYLGAETAVFANRVRRACLTDVIIVGSNLFYKGLDEYYTLAKRFPRLRFHVVGDGMGAVDPEAERIRLGLGNVVCHGRLGHAALAELLKGVQLHIFPSRAEGFPKVTLECAAAGVPSIVYADYGANEWITTGRDGFVVNTPDEMVAVVQSLLDHPEQLQALADNARALAKRFDWSVLVKDWEAVIDDLTRRQSCA